VGSKHTLTRRKHFQGVNSQYPSTLQNRRPGRHPLCDRCTGARLLTFRRLWAVNNATRTNPSLWENVMHTVFVRLALRHYFEHRETLFFSLISARRQ